MQGELNISEIEDLLLSNYIGRIGCNSKGKTYVVPISYAYHEKAIYAHTFDGLKVEMMRENPEVCFQIDKMHDIADWESVIAWGKYEEINDKDKRIEALKILSERELPHNASETVKLSAEWPFAPRSFENIEGIVFKITINEKTGRFEKTESKFK